MENKAPRYINTNEIIYIYNRWIEQLQSPEDAGALEGVQTCLDVLLEQPVVDAVKAVHGEWIYENGEWVCSVCKEPALYEVQVYGGGNYKDCDLVRSNYCPNCGAKMDLEE